MAMYEWPELLKRWGQKKLSADQAIGQLLQWGQQAAKLLTKLGAQVERLKRRLAEVVSRLEALERRWESLERRVAALESRRQRRGRGRKASR